jgi:ABC-2 type transport system permease protein
VMLEASADFLWGGLPAAVPLLAAVAVLCRALFGIALAMLWLSPLILLVMAASAWLKRWGLPLLVGSGLLIAVAEERLAGTRHYVDMLAAQFRRVGEAFINRDTGLGIEAANVAGKGFPQLLADMPMLLIQDAGRAVANLATPALLPTLLVAGLCFYALVLKRQRGG